MSINRSAKKRDANEAHIISALRQVGCLVIQEETGPYDILVGYNRAWYPIEIKVEGKNANERQAGFIKECAAHKLPCGVAHSTEEVFRIIGYGG